MIMNFPEQTSERTFTRSRLGLFLNEKLNMLRFSCGYIWLFQQQDFPFRVWLNDSTFYDRLFGIESTLQIPKPVLASRRLAGSTRSLKMKKAVLQEENRLNFQQSLLSEVLLANLLDQKFQQKILPDPARSLLSVFVCRRSETPGTIDKAAPFVGESSMVIARRNSKVCNLQIVNGFALIVLRFGELENFMETGSMKGYPTEAIMLAGSQTLTVRAFLANHQLDESICWCNFRSAVIAMASVSKLSSVSFSGLKFNTLPSLETLQIVAARRKSRIDEKSTRKASFIVQRLSQFE